MVSRRELLESAGALTVGAGLAGCTSTSGGRESATDGPHEDTTMNQELIFESPMFEPGGTVPTTYTCEGKDVSPLLTIGNVPTDARSLAVVVDDPDAPSGTFTHWLLWNVPPDVETIPEDVPRTETVERLSGARQGTNGFGELGYRGPCPPTGDSPHRYQFQLYVLDSRLDLQAGAKRQALLDATEPVRITTAAFTATFGR